MASVHLAPIGNAFQFLDSIGRPLNAGQLFAYAAGTSTPQATYTDATGLIQNANPIVLGTDGRVPLEIWLVDGLSYKFVLKDSLNNSIATYDNLYGLAKTTTATIYNVKDYGAIGDGVSNDSPAAQAALNAVPVTGGTVFFPDGLYRVGGLVPNANTTIQLSPGAVLLADSSIGNMIIIQNGYLQTPTLSAVSSNGYQVTVSTTGSFNVGDYVVVAAGNTFGNGPLEFNQVDTVVNGTVLALRNPCQIDFSSLGLPGANPLVLRLGASPIRNVRITGGSMRAYQSTSNAAFFQLTHCENVEIDHIIFDGGAGSGAVGLGSAIIIGSDISHLNWHDCVVRGERTINGFQATILTACGNSEVVANALNVGNPFAVGSLTATPANCIFVSLGSWRNRIDDNLIYPLAVGGSAAIATPSWCFMNVIRGNQIYGSPFAVNGGTNLIGIDTQATANLPAAAGNVISGNILNDVMVGIKDAQQSSVIKDNIISNFFLNASSIGISSATVESLSPWFTNTFVNFQVSVTQTSGGPAGRFQAGAVTFANVGTPANGSMLYVSDGTSGSAPLTGGGTGCFAIRQNGAWKGL